MNDSAPARCHVWWSRPGEVQAWHEELLDHVELERSRSYRHDIDRQRFVMGVALSRLAVAQLANVDASQVEISRRCPDCARPHGKPTFIGLAWHLSVTHSGDAVGVAMSESGPIGLDVEKVNPSIPIPEEMVLTPMEQDRVERIPAGDRYAALLRYWVRKEAVLKATAEGLRRSMTTVEIMPPEGGGRFVDGRDGSPMVLSDIDAPVGHYASVAVQSDSDYLTITRHDAAQRGLPTIRRVNVGNGRLASFPVNAQFVFFTEPFQVVADHKLQAIHFLGVGSGEIQD